MRFFTIHLKDKAGNLVDYMTGEKTLTELVDKYDNVLMFLEKKGFTNIKNTDLPKPIEKPSESTTVIAGTRKDYCYVHNAEMQEREGKFGKFYSHSMQQGDKTIFCNGKGWKI